MADLPPDIVALNFEDALAELDKIVRQLEAGATSLDESINAYTRGEQLKRHCEDKLKEAQAKVDRIVAGPDGALSIQPAGIE